MLRALMSALLRAPSTLMVVKRCKVNGVWAACVGAAQMRTSAKFQLLAVLLPDLRAAGSRPLLFSQWTSVLDLLEWLLQVCRLRSC